MITNKSKRITIEYTPMKTSVSMEILNNVAGRQSYNAVLKEYTPDYTIVPLTLFPRCTAVDPDQYTPAQEVNAKLTNMVWTEKVADKEKQIASGTEYDLTIEGAERGKLIVKKNSTLVNPITLNFKAEYVDPRTKQVYVFRSSFTIIVNDETKAQPQLFIDSPETVEWNPLRQPSPQKIIAKLISGDEDLTKKPGASFRWYRKLDDGTLDPVGTNGDNDWEVLDSIKTDPVEEGQHVLNIDREFIGEQQTYICRAHYNPDGTPVEPTDKDPLCVTTIVRKIPHLECDWEGVTYGVPNGNTNIYPKGYVKDTKGVIDNPDEWLKFVWMAKKPGAAAYSKVAEGREPTISFVDGMMLDLHVEDKGPQALIVDDDNANIYITDEQGNPTYQRMYE